jgi:hypothetical protein
VQVGRLRALHLAIAFGTLDASLLGALVPHDRWPVGWALAGIDAAILLTALGTLALPGMTSRDRPAGWAQGLASGLRTAAVLLTLTVLGYALWPRTAWPTAGGLPGYGKTITLLFAAQLLLLLGLAAVAVAQRCPGQYLGGLAGPIVASLGLGVAAAFSSGATFRVADFLDRSANPAGPVSAVRLRPSAALQWSAFGMAITVTMVLLVVLGAALFLMPKLRRAAQEATDSDFPHCRDVDPERAAEIDDAIAGARLTDHSGPLLLWMYLPLALAAIALTVLALLDIGPVDLAPAGSAAATVLALLTNLGTYLTGAATLGLMWVAIQAYRNQSMRRVVGILWDLGTFWPRAAHPLAPPCYAERAIPELATRTTYLATQDRVILSGHSQGSVLVAATVLQLSPSTLDNVTLLTHGSPLYRLYATLFPAYINAETLGAMGTAVHGRWINLWRDTDPIGAAIGEPARDLRLVDPAGFFIPFDDTVFPQTRGHSAYFLESAFGAAIGELCAPDPPPSSGPVDPD